MKKKSVKTHKNNAGAQDNVNRHEQTEEKLRYEEQRFRALIEHSSDIIVVINLEGTIIYVNSAVERVLGFKPEERIGAKGFELIHPDDMKFLTDSFNTLATNTNSTVIQGEMHLRHKDGSWRTLEAVGSNLVHNNVVEAVIVNYRDITERKQAEEALRNDQQELRAIMDASPIGVSWSDMQGNIKYTNHKFQEIFGYTIEEIPNIDAWLLLAYPSPAYREYVLSLVSLHIEAQTQGKEANPAEVTVVCKNGSISHVLQTVLFTSNRILVIYYDITERKRAEMSLLENEERYRTMFENTGTSMILIEEDMTISMVNAEFVRNSGYSLDEINGRMKWTELVHPDEIGRMVEQHRLRRESQGGALPGYELRYITKTGDLRDALLSIQLVPGTKKSIASLIDITERKQAEKKLMNSEEKFRTLAESSPFAIMMHQGERWIYANHAAVEISGYTEDELYNMHFWDFVHPDYRNLGKQRGLDRQQGKVLPRDYELKIIAKNGAEKWVSLTGNKIQYEDKPTALISVTDITERKLAEELLKQSEEKYRLLADHMKDQVWIMNLDLKVTYISPSVEKLTGYTLNELKHLPLDKILTSASFKAAMDFFSMEMPKALAAPSDYILTRSLEMEVCCKDGHTVWEESMFSLIRDDNGKPLSILGEARDITERKQIEYDLRASESNFRNSLDDSLLGVRISTIEGETVYANRAVLNIYGYDSIEELKKTPIKERYTPESYAEFQLRKEKRLRGEFGPSEYEISIVRKNGEIHHLHVFRKEIFWNDKRQSQVIYQDITLRRHAEAELQQTLESLRKAVGTTIQVLVSALESRDPYTSGHQSRSADLACVIATEMGLAQEKVEGIRMAGVIHDIGKLSIPAEILSKPTKLTNIEFSLIKEHSRSGYEMLKDVQSPWPLAQIVYQHHERMNGSGYPRNLKGDEILIEARIMAVADVVEAMASHRPYRPTLGIEAALEEIEKNKGILYDNTVANTCLKLFREKGYQLT
jgi:PAS domain S-box-containing protein